MLALKLAIIWINILTVEKLLSGSVLTYKMVVIIFLTGYH